MNTFKSQSDVILQYYKDRPDVEIKHSDAVDWATKKWLEITGKVFRDPDRAVRKFSQQGILIKVQKGVYKYDPNHKVRNDLYDFTAAQKAAILERDDYKYVVCGRGVAEGVDLQIDHVRPKDKGGLATLDNGQTLCAQHNFIKKNYSQTEAGKRFFMKLYEQASHIDDAETMSFCSDIMAVYDQHGYDSQISWSPSNKQ